MLNDLQKALVRSFQSELIDCISNGVAREYLLQLASNTAAAAEDEYVLKRGYRGNARP